MALTNYERQKRWREKNRVIYNLRRRNARKNPGTAAEKAVDDNHVVQESSPATLPTHLPTIEELRELIKQPVEASTMPVMKPKVYRSETGAVITEKQYLEREEEKRLAKQKGYEIDEYAQ